MCKKSKHRLNNTGNSINRSNIHIGKPRMKKIGTIKYKIDIWIICALIMICESKSIGAPLTI